MKPRRLDPAELTDEDRDANYVFCVARGLSEFRGRVLGVGMDADRRDADLMHFLARNREPPGPLRFYEDGQPVVLVPLVHVMLFMDPEWPLGHNIISFA